MAAPALPPIPRFRILEVLGTSLYATTYKAAAKSNPARWLSLKVLKNPLRHDSQKRYVHQKVERLKVIHERRVITPLAFETFGDTQIIIQDYFPGQVLSAWRCTRNQAGIENFLSIAMELALALAAVHEAGIVHGGVKPHNILIRPETQEIRLIDFITPIDIREVSHFIYDPDFVESTLAYTSPEQTGRINHRVDFSTDMYSLGISFYELLTGGLPFSSVDPLALIHSHLAEEAPPVHTINRAVPETLSRIIAKLCAKEPEKRYQSGMGLYADLLRCQQELGATGNVTPFRLGLRDHSRRVVFISRMVGRDTEARAVLAGYGTVVKGGFRALFISGLPGIGKTRLIQELQRPLVETLGYFTSGKFDQYQKNIPYSSLRQALRNLVRTFLTESDERALAWKSKILAAAGGQGRLLAEVIPELDILVGPQPEVPALPPVEARNRFNNLFGRFLACLASAENPLVLFIDDLQWCDSATFDFLEHVFANIADFPYLYFIGAYRNNEVDAAHPLARLIQAAKARRDPLEEIHITPLDAKACHAMVAYILDLSLEETALLSGFLAELTEGNPLFVSESLSWLHGQDLLKFGEHGQWQWDMEGIHASQMPPTVVELFGAKVRKLPPETLDILVFCACMGNRFLAEDIALIKELPLLELFERLKVVLSLGLLMESKSELQFVHDRVQEAVLRLLDDPRRREIHWRIGQHLLKAVPKGAELGQQENLFTIAAHLNLGQPKRPSRAVALELSAINALAGDKALEALATQSANEYFRAALGLLPGDAWTRHYQATFHIHQKLAKTELMGGRYDQSERLIDTLVERAANDLDRAEALAEQTTSLSSIGNFIKAIEVANRGLAYFGKAIPEDADEARQRTAPRMDAIHAPGRDVWGTILRMPFTQERRGKIELKFYSELIPDLYMSGLVPQLYLSAAQSTEHCLAGGMDESVIYSFSIMGLNLGEQGQFDVAFRYEDLARELCARHPDTFGATRGMNGIVWCNMHSRSHPRDIVAYCRKGIQCGKSCGDLYNAGLSYGPLMWNQQVLGTDFAAIEATAQECLEFSRKNQLEFSVGLAEAVHAGWVEPMQSPAAAPEPMAERLQRWEQRNHVASAGSYFVHLALSHYYYGRHAEAAEALTAVERYLLGLTDNVLKRQWYAFRVLNALAQFRLGEFAGDRHQLRAMTAPLIAQLETWARLGPLLRPYLALIQAEHARALGSFREARSLFLDAIETAHAQGYTFLEGYIHEALGEYLLEQGQTSAAGALRTALALYRQCRAQGKEIHVLERFQGYFEEEAQPLPGGEAVELVTLPSLDTEYLMKSARALSAETDLDTLLERIMAVMLEATGARSGFLLMLDGDKLALAAERRVGDKASPRKQGLAHAPELCMGIVHYVMRTKAPLALQDALAAPEFQRLPEVKAAELRAILCLPIIHQSQMTGVLYLENRLAPGLFTPDKAHVAELLAAQAAISLVNARLIREMREARDKIQGFNADLARRVEEEVQRNRDKDHLLIRQSRLAVMGEMIGNIAHQWRQPLNALGLVFANLQDAYSYSELTPHYMESQAAEARRLIERMSRTINDFRDFFKPDKRKEVFHLKDAIGDALGLVSASFKAHHIEVDTLIEADACIEGFAGEFAQVLLNVLSNAKEAILHGGTPRGRVRVRLWAEDGEALVTVADNGGGIREAALERLFEPYFSTKEGGTGIGLYMSKMIIERSMAGRIEARNEGEGAVFTLRMRQSRAE
jgi:signal transduction histidine kinase/tRNA A-37 threonylcarbamoyl transferase component Bud32